MTYIKLRNVSSNLNTHNLIATLNYSSQVLDRNIQKKTIRNLRLFGDLSVVKNVPEFFFKLTLLNCTDIFVYD